MRENLSKEMRDCYAHAKACARKAEDALTEEGLADFLRLEQSWLALARSYETSTSPIAKNLTRFHSVRGLS